MKSAKEKKRKHSRRESSDGERKRKSTELSDPKEEQNHAQEVKEEPSDIEEGGLDLTVPFKPISAYVSNRQEMLEQCFHVLGQNKLKKMLPNELKDCTFTEIKTLCWDQLQLLSENNLLQILEGKEVTPNPEGDTNRTSADSQQDNSVDSTSSMKEIAEGEDKQGLSGEESDVLSINADTNDSDIEGHKDPKPQEKEVLPVTPPASSALPPDAGLQSDEPKLELQRDIDRSVSEILALNERQSDEPQLKQVSMETAPVSVLVPAAAPSAQQLALLELEMRARAIKALMKANEVKK